MGEKRSVSDWIKGWVVGLGAIGTGAWAALAPPPDMAEEIPWHFELGMGIAAFGALFLMALFVTRAKSLLLFLAIGSFSAAGLWAAWIGPEDMELWLRLVMGVASFFAMIFALYCLVSVFTGEDPAGDDI